MKNLIFSFLILMVFCGCGQASQAIAVQPSPAETAVCAMESSLNAGNVKTVSCASCGRKFDEKVKVCPYDGSVTVIPCKR